MSEMQDVWQVVLDFLNILHCMAVKIDKNIKFIIIAVNTCKHDASVLQNCEFVV